jgi:four helix bundle protein
MMQSTKDIDKRTYDFAVRIIKLYQHLYRKPYAGRIIGQQILRAGTSIGANIANIEEAQAGQSRADFISKNAIALKESRETSYWLRLLGTTGILAEQRLTQLQSEVEEITGIIASIIVSAKRNGQ